MEYKDAKGNLIKEGFYQCIESKKVAYLFLKNVNGEPWLGMDTSFGLVTPTPARGPFFNISYCEDFVPIKDIQNFKPEHKEDRTWLKSKLEQLSQQNTHPFGEWGKEPLEIH